MVRKTGVLILVAGIIVIGPMLLFSLAISAGTQRTIYERATSLDGWHEARVQLEDAGAISSFSRLVFVKSRWNLSDAPLLSCRAFWTDGEEIIHLYWLSNHLLQIEYTAPPHAVKDIAKNCGSIQIVAKQLQE